MNIESLNASIKAVSNALIVTQNGIELLNPLVTQLVEQVGTMYEELEAVKAELENLKAEKPEVLEAEGE